MRQVREKDIIKERLTNLLINMLLTLFLIVISYYMIWSIFSGLKFSDFITLWKLYGCWQIVGAYSAGAVLPCFLLAKLFTNVFKNTINLKRKNKKRKII